MKYRNLGLLIVSAVVIAACAPAVVEEPISVNDAPAQEVIEEEAPAVEVDNELEPSIEEVGDGETVSFSQDIWPVIEEFALEAHGGRGGVFLESYDDIMNYVVPGNPEGSRLYKALIGDGERQMPPSGRLPDATIQLFYDWIKQGAPNN